MSRTSKIILVVFSLLLLLGVSGIVLFNTFLNAFAPPKIKVTYNYISTNQDFINGCTIGTVEADSIGQKGYPVLFTITHFTSCNIEYTEGKPPDAPDKIYFNKKGKYHWREEDVHIPMKIHGYRREITDSVTRIMTAISEKQFETSPLTFATNQWYFIDIYDPSVNGIFIYIDNKKKIQLYLLPSGVSPI